MLTDQEIFDTVTSHLLRQGTRSLDPTMRYCAYRGKDGHKCSAGALITDENYTPRLERNGANDFEVKNALRESGINIDNEDVHHLVVRLQNIHDTHSEPDGWIEPLTWTAMGFNLNTFVLRACVHKFGAV